MPSRESPPSSPPVYVVGEVLWDALPSGLFLGGAPANVGVHLHQLGVPAALVSRVGVDRLGREAVRRLTAHGLAVDLVQTDPARETGFVEATVEADGGVSYRIAPDAAWDALTLEAGLVERVAAGRALVFGTLAQRSGPSRRTLRALWDTGVPLVYDVNLRPPDADRDTVAESLAAAGLVKLNAEELDQTRAWFDLPAADPLTALAERFDVPTVCVTRGAHGARLLHRGEVHDHPGHPTTVVDPVGAGDAFLAALLRGVLEGDDPSVALDAACRRGAFVASRRGATPDLDGL